MIAEPNIEILGVYRLELTPDVFSAQLPMYGDKEQCLDHLSSVVLIEALVREGGGFNLDDIKQPRSFLPNPSIHQGLAEPTFQVPWDEGLLTVDGEQLLARSIGCVKGEGPLRFAFYLHYWDESLPLHWTYGQISCPAPTVMPERLKRVMPYRPCD